MPKRKKKAAAFTARGTPRLTSEQKSRIMELAWERRRAKGEAPPKKKRKTPDPVRSEAMIDSWARRRRRGEAPPKKKKRLLSHRQRSAIAIAAAKKRFAGEKARRHEDLKLLNLPNDAMREEIAKAFRKARRRLGLSPKAVRNVIREALRTEQKAAARRRRTARKVHTHARSAHPADRSASAETSL